MSEPRLAALLIAIGALAIYATIVFVGLRLVGQRLALPLMAGSAALVFVAVAAWGFAGGRFAFWHFAAFFSCGVATLVFVYGAVLKSLSLQMLATIAQAPSRSATTQQLASEIVRTAFAERIELLNDARLVERAGQGYALTSAGVAAAARIRRIQQLCRIDASPLYSN